MPVTLQQLADHLGHSFSGDADLNITGVASLTSARSGDLCFIGNRKNNKLVGESQCSVLIVPEGFRDGLNNKSYIYSDNPQLSFVRAIEQIAPERLKTEAGGIHPTARVADTAILGRNVSIGALSVIGEGVEIGSNSQLGAACIIENNAKIGQDCYLHSRVTIAHRVIIGDRCIMHPGAVIGSEGFGLVEDNRQWIKVPQIGSVNIGDDVEIGANTTIDRGALDDTILEHGCKLDNLIQVAHNVRIGEHTAIAACVGIAGSAIIGRHCKIGGAAVVLGHLRIVDNVMITAMSLVTKDVNKPGVYSSGTPLMENSEWHKANVRYKSLDSLARKVKNLGK